MNKFINNPGRPAHLPRIERAGGPGRARPPTGSPPVKKPALPFLLISIGAAAVGFGVAAITLTLGGALAAAVAQGLSGGLVGCLALPFIVIFMVPLAGPGALAAACLLVAVLAPWAGRRGDPDRIRRAGSLLGSVLGLGNAVLGCFLLQGGTLHRLDSLWLFGLAGVAGGWAAGRHIAVSLLRWRAGL